MNVVSILSNQEKKTELLINVFNQLFLNSLNTKLVRGADEPLYTPKNTQQAFNCIIFAHGYFSSALHEISHWLVAGAQRRTLEDYGYWYQPDGRTEQQQQAFEIGEIKPQAIEWILSKACGHVFHFSADNLSSGLGISINFKRSVHCKVIELLDSEKDNRMQRLLEALCAAFNQDYPQKKNFILSD